MSDSNRNTYDELKDRQQQSPSAARSSSLGERPAAIEEQQPAYRSVAINPLTQHKRTLHFEPPLRRVDPGGLKQLRPTREVSQPELRDSKLPAKELPRFRSKSESSLVRKWHVEHSGLTVRPDDLPPLTRSSRVVHGTTSKVISNRIADTLQKRSIKTKFSKKSDSVAKCRNTDFCKFTIRLYLEEDGGVLVEVQRLCGDAVSFMRDCKAILNSAEGKTGESSAEEDEKPIFLRMPVSQMEFAKRASLPPISPEDEADTVKTTADLLSSPQSDTNMLGMESLVIQTDPLKTLKSTAIIASRRILCHDDPSNKEFNMHNYVMSLLIYTDEPSPSPTLEETALEDHSARLRNLAISALCNALALFSSEKMLLSTIDSNHEWYSSVLIPKLLKDLGSAGNNPHDACYATRCLSTLAGASADFAVKMQEKGWQDAVQKAHDVGLREFALLARDAESCQNVLRCCV